MVSTFGIMLVSLITQMIIKSGITKLKADKTDSDLGIYGIHGIQ